MSKLTARLSDGTEFEVLTQSLTVGGGTQTLLVRPLKPSPPKEMFVQEYKDGSLSMLIYSSADIQEREDAGSKFHRYVLAEEGEELTHEADAYRYFCRPSEQAPRVFYLNFRKDGKLLRVLGPIENGNTRVLLEDQLHKNEYAHEVIRVRESAE